MRAAKNLRVHDCMRRPYFAAAARHSATTVRGEERLLDLAHGTERVPATFLLPPAARSAPAALLLHGFSSSKERMAQSVGRALQQRGVASLALDLPFHGERDGGRDEIPYRNPLALVAAWTTAVREARAAIEWLAAQPEVDAEHIGAIGYSLGGFLALMTAAEEPTVRVVALAAAGDLPATTPYAALVRRAVDPLRAVRKLSGRPLLLVNGRRDTTTRPAQAERLFAYAEEPKELRWYDGGHWPPPSAIEDAAAWTAEQLRGRSSRAGKRQVG
ncbi:MAG: alpha/beta hydrolase [Gemmatimonadetes bacterium]|nr:MAG: alpha/beta hydrolase [Gemmatimonadota bacterium]